MVTAWTGKLLENETLKAIAAKHGKNVAQVILRWDLQVGVVTIPKSVNEGRIVQNANVFDFQLDIEDLAAIEALNQDLRYGSDPDNFNF